MDISHTNSYQQFLFDSEANFGDIWIPFSVWCFKLKYAENPIISFESERLPIFKDIEIFDRTEPVDKKKDFCESKYKVVNRMKTINLGVY